jgi:hypothetical protein
MAAAMQAVVHGHVDEAAMFVDAIEPIGIGEAAAFLKDAGPFSYAGRARLSGDGMTMHGHRLVDFETLQTKMGGHVLYVTLYRDPSGKIAYVEMTN